MKKTVFICALICLSTIANAGVSWQGLDFISEEYLSGIEVNPDTGNLEVTSVDTIGSARVGSLSTDYFRICFDLDATVHNLPNSTLVGVANYNGNNQVQVAVNLAYQLVSFDNLGDGSTHNWSTSKVPELPTTGQHSLTFQVDEVSNLLTITLDDSVVISPDFGSITMNGITTARIGAGDPAYSGSAVFTCAHVPEPATIAFLTLGCFLARKRK